MRVGSEESAVVVQMRDEGGFTKRVAAKMEQNGQIQEMLEIVPKGLSDGLKAGLGNQGQILSFSLR